RASLSSLQAEFPRMSAAPRHPAQPNRRRDSSTPSPPLRVPTSSRTHPRPVPRARPFSQASQAEPRPYLSSLPVRQPSSPSCEKGSGLACRSRASPAYDIPQSSPRFRTQTTTTASPSGSHGSCPLNRTALSPPSPYTPHKAARSDRRLPDFPSPNTPRNPPDQPRSK